MASRPRWKYPPADDASRVRGQLRLSLDLEASTASVFQFALRVCRAETWALAPVARPENNKRSKSWKIYGTKETDTGGFKRQLEACGRTCIIAVWRVADADHDLCGELRPPPH